MSKSVRGESADGVSVHQTICFTKSASNIELEADFICLIKLFVPFYYSLFAGLDRLIAESTALVQTQNSGLSVLQAPALPMVLA